MHIRTYSCSCDNVPRRGRRRPRVPGETRERLAAARLVLDFTKQKPVAKSEVSIGKAEEFLSSLLEDDGQETTGN